MTGATLTSVYGVLCDAVDVADRYVTTGEAAKAISVSLTTLQRWAHAGLVTPALRTPGGHFRWDLDDLRRQLAALPPEATDGG